MTIMNIGTNNYRAAWFKDAIFGYVKVMVSMYNDWNHEFEVIGEYKLYSDDNAEIVAFAKEKVLEIVSGFEDDYSVNTMAAFMEELEAARIDGETNALNGELASMEETAETLESVSTEETAATEETSRAADVDNVEEPAQEQKPVKRRAHKEKTYKGLTKRELIDKIATARAATTATKNVQEWRNLLRTYPIESKVTPGFSLAYEYDHLFA